MSLTTFWLSKKNKKKIENLVDNVVKEPTNNYWWEEDFFSKDDEQSTVDTSKTIVDDIKTTNDIDLQALSDNILRNLRPIDDRSIQQLIDDDFIPTIERFKKERTTTTSV